MTRTRSFACAAALFFLSGLSTAADWSDTAIGWRTGTQFREPQNPNAIGKNIINITHASGYRYGNQFLNLDLLKSNSKDPSSPGGSRGAFEAYLTYRHTLDFAKISGRSFVAGPIRNLGLTTGIDLNSKDDAGYNSRKRMFVLGPQIMWNVPGRFNSAILMAWESNAPHGPFAPISGVRGRYHYKAHPMLALDWGIPLSERVTFEGFANFITAKGRDEVGRSTGPETNIDMRVMYDAGAAMGIRKRALLVGLEYQYWHNKFGNTDATTRNRGNTANTPMLRVEHHF